MRVRGIKRRERARRRDELLQLVALEGYETRLPGQLSGGQQQRVAVARALAHEPQVLLLDEPFGALDAKIRVELRETIRQVQRRLGMTTILVTHDQEEAFALADRIGIMHNGRLLETGRAETLYRRPATRFVATFLGAANLFLGERGPAGLQARQSLRGQRPAACPLRDHRVMRSSRWCVPRTSRSPRTRSSCDSGPLGSRTCAVGGFRRRVRAPARAARASSGKSSRRSAAIPPRVRLARPRRPSPTWSRSRAPAPSRRALALTPGKRVALGIRRFHLLPTPIASFRLLSTEPAAAAALRRSAAAATTGAEHAGTGARGAGRQRRARCRTGRRRRDRRRAWLDRRDRRAPPRRAGAGCCAYHRRPDCRGAC